MAINPETWKRPEYRTFLEFKDIYLWVNDIYNKVSDSVKMGMDLGDTYVLAQSIVNSGNGNHLEIGSLFGGSTIIAALTKIEFGIEGNIFCIDDTKAVGKDYIHSNLRQFEVSNRVYVHIGKSDPFPMDDKFNTVLIDAGHDYSSCITDFNNVKGITSKYILIHDYDPEHIGVVRASREAMKEWMPVFISGHMLVLEKP